MNLERILAELETAQADVCEVLDCEEGFDEEGSRRLLVRSADRLEELIRDVRSEVLANPGYRP